GNYLVKVCAQVMTRDDSSGGWVPLSGGGLANVSVRRRPTSDGHQSNNTNGSGISTMTASTTNSTHSVSTTAVTNTQSHGSSSNSPPGATKKRHEYLIYGIRITDQSTLNLPVEPPEPRPSSDTPHGIVRVPNYHSQCSDLPDSHKPIHYIGGPSIKVPPSQHPLASTEDVGSDNYPYVQLTTLNHEYLYPIIGDHKGDRLNRHNTSSSLKKPDTIVSQPSKNTMKRNIRLRCKHCQELYTEQHNPRGSCEYAPDPIRRGIAKISCLSCAQGMLYHCMNDAEGDFSQNPCSCSTEEGCGRRWFGLALLSLIVPCLWIYPPLRAVHWCGTSCGMCGGRHHPME
ncbi:Sprouty-related, EVH1 domain-containing protein 2, partial [Habropoda laboriosa]